MEKMKPFKLPSLVSKAKVATQQPEQCEQPPAKKRRITGETSENDIIEHGPVSSSLPRKATPPDKYQLPARKPLLSVPANTLPPSSRTSNGPEGYYAALW